MSRLDLGAAGFVEDPYPSLAGLRARGDLVWHQPSGSLLATSHAAVTATLRHRGLGRVWADREPADRFAPFNLLHLHQMMENEPPAHTRLRRLVASAFGRGHVERMRPRVEAIAADLLDAFDRPQVDVIGAYAEPLPVAVIADLLGVPTGDRALLRDWSQAIVRMYEYDRSEALESAAVRASVEFADYVRDLVRTRTACAGDDLISDFIRARDAGGRLSEAELVASVVLLLNAGHEASVNAFGNGLHALLAHAELESGGWRRVDQVAVDTALEEMLRFDAPLQLFERTATADAELLGVRVVAGTRIAALLGSANRDAIVFDDPDAFQPARKFNPHVGFGMGVHFCLGAPLARMELQIAMRALLLRFPRMRLAPGALRRRTFVLRGFAFLPVDLDPAT